MSLELKELIEQFLKQSEADLGFLEYTEPTGLRRTLVSFLKEHLGATQYRVKPGMNESEQSVYDINITSGKNEFVKMYMDVYIHQQEGEERYCIELKQPSNDAVPDRIFQTFEDVNFLEELRFDAEFSEVALLFVTDSKVFMDDPGKKKEGIYKYFRKETRICQPDPSEMQDFIMKNYKLLNIRGNYTFQWRKLGDQYFYFVIAF